MSFVLAWLLRFFLFRIPFMQWLRVGAGILITFLIFLYVLLSMGLHTMARKSFLRGAWLAWVPVGQSYVAGAIADQATRGYLFRILLPCLQVGPLLLMLLIPGLEGAWWWLVLGLCVTFFVFYFIALHRIYGQYARFATPLLVLSIIFYFLSPIFLFALRNKVPHALPESKKAKKARARVK